jgi:cation:H+ antiporter
MTLLLNTALLIISILFLWGGANYLVESAERIANTFRIPQLIIGLTVVAFGTSAPEFAVTIQASIIGNSSISVGNIVGSNIFNLGFILGLTALISTVSSSKKMVYRDGLFMLATTLVLLVCFYTGYTLNRFEGALLFILLISYLLYLFISKEKLEEEITTEKASLKDYIILPLSLAAIVGGGNLLVSSSTAIAKFFGLSDWLIAITVVAAGTSAPEMVTSIVAAIKGKHEMSAGNLIGSNIFNILGVLGVAGMIHPLGLNPDSFHSLLILTLLIIMVIIFMRTKWKVSRLEGALLILAGFAMWFFDFYRMAGTN